MDINLDTLDRNELQKLRQQIDKRMDQLAVEEQKAALDAAEKAAAQHGYSLAELTGMKKARGKAANVNPPKYRNPENPSQTWTGKGRRPQWIKDAEANGTDLSKFAI